MIMDKANMSELKGGITARQREQADTTYNGGTLQEVVVTAEKTRVCF